MKSKVSEYIEDIIYFKLKHNGEAILKLQEDAVGQVADLHDVGEAILEVTDDLIKHIDTYQAITDARLRAIVSALPDEVQENIYYDFNENEDDLFKN